MPENEYAISSCQSMSPPVPLPEYWLPPPPPPAPKPTRVTVTRMAGIARRRRSPAFQRLCDAGAAIYRHNPVRAIERTSGGAWRVVTRDGAITCEVVVNAAGYRAREVGRMVGLDLPLVSLQHQYLVTEAIPAIEAHGRLLPLVRDPDVSWYLRQERAGLLLGPYE